MGSPVMSSLLDRIPYVPKLTNFLGCFDLHQGVKYASIFLTVLWIVYAIVSFFYLALGFAVFSLIWCLVNVACYGLVVLGLRNSNRLYLLPALFLSIFNITWGLINAIINFIFLAIFSAIWILALQLVVAYYYCALKSVHDLMKTGGTSTAPAPAQNSDPPPAY